MIEWLGRYLAKSEWLITKGNRQVRRIQEFLHKNLNLFTAPETPVATVAARDPVDPEAEAM